MLLLMLLLLAQEPTRVADARARISAELKNAVQSKGVSYPPRAVLLRSLKEERRFEVWIGNDPNKPLVLLESLPVCSSSGVLGPKRKQGDMQVPEGVYRIDKLNPFSTFHLALHVDYPNAADRVRAKKLGVTDPGGEIMVHGNCVTIGCIPLQDGPIERVYLLVHDARAKGAAIPIHILPRALHDADLPTLSEAAPDDDTRALWQALAPIDKAFVQTKTIPRVRIKSDGSYELRR
jgi:murein L,D-transpeptidase YafK